MRVKTYRKRTSAWTQRPRYCHSGTHTHTHTRSRSGRKNTLINNLGRRAAHKPPNNTIFTRIKQTESNKEPGNFDTAQRDVEIDFTSRALKSNGADFWKACSLMPHWEMFYRYLPTMLIGSMGAAVCVGADKYRIRWAPTLCSARNATWLHM